MLETNYAIKIYHNDRHRLKKRIRDRTHELQIIWLSINTKTSSWYVKKSKKNLKNKCEILHEYTLGFNKMFLVCETKSKYQVT